MCACIRVGIVGVGTIARTYFAAFRNMKNVRVAFLCDIVPDAMESAVKLFPDLLSGVGRFASSDEALEAVGTQNVDLVLVAAPLGTHFMLAERVLKRGVRTLLEKPAVSEIAELESLYALAKSQNTHFQTMYHSAFAPEVERFLKIKTGVERRFGTLRGFAYDLLDPAVPKRVFEISTRPQEGSYVDSTVNALSVLERIWTPEIFRALQIVNQSFSQLPGLRNVAGEPLSPQVDTNSVTQYRIPERNIGGVIRTDWGHGWNYKAVEFFMESGRVLLSSTAQSVMLDDFSGNECVLECSVPGTPRLQRQYEIMFDQIFFVPDSLETSERRDLAIHHLLLDSL